MALGSTQPLTDFLGGKYGLCVRLTTLPPSCAAVMKSGNPNFLEPSGPLQACNGTALPYVYNYIPETNHVARVCSGCSCSVLTICAICNVISPVKYVLCFHISAFRSMFSVPNFSSLISCIPGMLVRYSLSDFEMVPVAPIFAGITFAFTFHMR